MKSVVLKGRKLPRIAYSALKWHLKYYRGKAPKPLVVGLFTTNRCNLRCSICSIWRDRKQADLGYERLKKLVDAVTPGCCYFSFSGGEPLLVKEIDRMIAYAAGKVPYVHLVSNGLAVDRETVLCLRKAGLSEISFSLDGERDWHNRARGSEKSYDAVIEAVRLVKKHGPEIEIVLNTVLFPGAPEQAQAAVRRAADLDVLIKVQPVNKHFDFADAESLPADPVFSGVDYDGLNALIGEWVRDKRVVNSRYYLKKIPDYFRGELKLPLIRPKCKLPYMYLECNSYGNISPCMIATGWESGFAIEDLDDSSRSERYFALQRSLESCRRCDRSMYICYWEPMIHFPITHLLKYGLKR